MLVGDVLHYGTQYLPSLVVNHVAIPVRVQFSQLPSYSVVLPHEQGVHG